MKLLKTFFFAAMLLMVGMNATAENKDNLIYNSEEVNGLMVGQTVYKNDGSNLVNYMKYNYKYDDQKRMIENESLKWKDGRWVNDLKLVYTYDGKMVTTTYYQWKQNKYVLIPEMTVTMDNANL